MHSCVLCPVPPPQDVNDTRVFALINTIPTYLGGTLVNGTNVGGYLLRDAIALDPLTGTLYVSARNASLLDYEALWRLGARDFVINVSVTDFGGNLMNESRLTTYAQYVRCFWCRARWLPTMCCYCVRPCANDLR